MLLNVQEAGRGKPLVLLHGLFGSGQNFGAIQRKLADQFRVLALDLRNHGASPHAAEMAYAAMAEDVVETLRARSALPCRLVGHSVGGKVAMRTALAEPDAIDHLVVADIAPAPTRPRSAPMRRRWSHPSGAGSDPRARGRSAGVSRA